ncbi:YadA C-terminal domain-containing protein [Acinetobacter sp. TR11]|uniref:YadA C-terminal domain-containing protein n=1 Tax=Acinetobacter sp. TR11 TaxID=3003393 RepID=UPI0022AC8374|nr:YadA C-terminal domain-containing protein [Acinetobacter sp. TR11]WAU74244.1 YadA C-terminal domain-containing protein [Acinetobacter sp. TR11]
MKLKQKILKTLVIYIITINAQAGDIVTESIRVTSPSGAVVSSISGDITESAYFYLRGESYLYGKSTIIGELNAQEVKADNIGITDKNNNKVVEISATGSGKGNLYINGYSHISDNLVVGEKIIAKDLEVNGTISGNFSGNVSASNVYVNSLYSENQLANVLQVSGHLNAKNIDLQGTNISSLADAKQDDHAVNLKQLNLASTKNLIDSKNYTNNIVQNLRDETTAEIIHTNKSIVEGDKLTLSLANKTTAETAKTIRSEIKESNEKIITDSRIYTDQVGINMLNNSKVYIDNRVDQLNQDFQSFKKDSYAATAASLATASLPQPSNAGYSMVSAGTGTWKGQQGFAIGMSGISEDNKVIYKLAGTGNTQGDFGGSAAIGYQW